MKQKKKNSIVSIAGKATLLSLISLPVQLMADPVLECQSEASQSPKSASDKQTVTAFEERVKDYVRLREQIEGKMPKLSKESTPEQIQGHQTAFKERVRAAKAGAKPGDVFTPDVANYIRTSIKKEFRGKRLQQLRETILEAETKGVPLRVNYPYPQSKELTEVPPTLLLILPQLPKQVRYRFVGRHLLLVDRENLLIIDYMTDALP